MNAPASYYYHEYTREEIEAWESKQDPDRLPVIDLTRLRNLKRHISTQDRLAKSRAARAVRLGLA